MYALLTAYYTLPRPLLAPIGGRLADLWGYPTFFFLTFLLAIPSYLLLPWVYCWLGPNGTARDTGRRPRRCGRPTSHLASDPLK